MSDTKKYYYMRLVDGFYDRPEIKLIEKIENGYQYVTILLKMYLRSLKNDGALVFTDGIPYDIQMLSNVIGHDMVMIEKAIEIFQKYKLVEIMDDGTIYMTKIQNFIGHASTEADRKRQFRARIEGHAGHLSDNRPPELDIELKIDTENKESVSGDGVPSPSPSYKSKDNVKNEANASNDKQDKIEYPPSLDTPSFRAAWGEWVQFRKEIKKRLTPSTVRMQLKNLSEVGEKAAIDAIHKSIEKGWQGLFVDKKTPTVSSERREVGSYKA